MKISIVTPTFNGMKYLPATGTSVLSQAGGFDLEWIVVDGGSTDGTVDYLRGLNDPHVRWVSEKDRGQSDAINKGLAMAGGAVVAWLNADDLYTPGTLAAVAEAFDRHPEAQWIAGRCDIIDSGGAPIRNAVTRYKDRSLRRYSYRRLLRENPISQPAVFWRREFGKKVGPIDVSLDHAMDYDLWLRMGRESDPLLLDRVVAHFRLHPESKSGTQTRERFDEQYLVASRYFGDDRASRWVHRLNVEKIVWSYRLMQLVGL
jgi:glycosyltransferase involved in cell wall biosynthesis